METYLTHVKRDESQKIQAEEPVIEHLRQTAARAAQDLAPVGLSQAGYTAGLLHDMGKCTKRFLAYIRDGVGRRGEVNHTFAGVRLLLERFHHSPPQTLEDIATELLALAVGEHHGLLDCVSRDGENGFRHRMTKEGIDYEEAVNGFFATCVDEAEITRHVQAAQAELLPVLEKIQSMTGEDLPEECYWQETHFYLGLLARLLVSAVIDGDRCSAAAFLQGTSFPSPLDEAARQALWADCLARVEQKLNALPQTSPIQRARRQISDQCRQAATQPGGIFRLNAPTGGGKTLSSLRFALAHAMQYGKQRLIFVSPLLSILDQNAKEIRKYIGDDNLILEHHSNLVRSDETDETKEQLDERELLTETWASPILITTLVQLLQVLFSGKTTAIRRFQALSNSVIVLDEVQTVPGKMLSLFSLAVNFLAEVCGATVVLCSATQPCVEHIAHPLHTPIPQLVPYDPALWQVFQRTDIRPVPKALSLEEIADLARAQLESCQSLLVVCNKKAEAERLYQLLKDGEHRLFHLSAAMCMKHREQTLEALRACLEQKQKVVCVSTQVIEAGVNISFSCVIRLCAGLDSVVQAAGRCNRNGDAGPGVLAPVYVVQPQLEDLDHLPDILWGQEATHRLLQMFANRPARFQGRLDSDEAVACYYRALYERHPTGLHDYPLKDGASLFSLLSENEYAPSASEAIAADEPVAPSLSSNEGTFSADEEPFAFRQAFRQAGAAFQVFEEDTTAVIVPYGDGSKQIENLGSQQTMYDPGYLQDCLRQAKPYTVNLYPYQLKYLADQGHLLPLAGGALGLCGHYNEETGFSMESEMEFMYD